ncbi:L-serine ammonia-lyase [Sphingomonas spermidinifaciens]|uniref:L-serine dehydratase n=1 Tax=Sphingomonas spermidinifaciens TaxID=1141889 RepID=A0A2A4B2N0_9SPHN|nr:L-serine ammonia-lyase [Sphingomonas spermidinifaciens]PCD02317.1 L-serine ammonia-lyase [Sphingomonas spermidinifaciens]
MVASVFDLFKIGVGPSSSHTMGPMTAACDFVEALGDAPVARLSVDLYGSLALTGRGHATDRAVMLGLSGCRPATVDPDAIDGIVAAVEAEGRVTLPGGRVAAFDPAVDLGWRMFERLDFHSNAMRLAAFDGEGGLILERTVYSVGGGAVVEADAVRGNAAPAMMDDPPHPYRSGADLLAHARTLGSIAGVQRANELAAIDETALSARLDAIAQAMRDCIDRGMRTHGILPGGLKVRRRAAAGFERLMARREQMLADPLSVIDWVNLWALAVNEENAAGGRVVTAPTNGAAGIVPAVLRYYERMVPGASPRGTEDFLLTAAAIGSLFKENASISGAEVGCQGEVGVACSMAAAGLCAVLGGTPEQVENAAEIGMEHNLGLTCDPVGGLVQVPCIERNAVGAIKAIEAARLALLGDGTHRVSLDEVIETMRKTGLDMGEKYKETAQGGLAANVVEC